MVLKIVLGGSLDGFDEVVNTVCIEKFEFGETELTWEKRDRIVEVSQLD